MGEIPRPGAENPSSVAADEWQLSITIVLSAATVVVEGAGLSNKGSLTQPALALKY
jgi:hypothetical protein